MFFNALDIPEHQWFAWYPVYAGDLRCHAWLTVVYRKKAGGMYYYTARPRPKD